MYKRQDEQLETELCTIVDLGGQVKNVMVNHKVYGHIEAELGDVYKRQVRGGMTSHAAVVARGMGTCCVSGCGDFNMDEENKKFTLAGQTFTEGSEISIDALRVETGGSATFALELEWQCIISPSLPWAWGTRVSG